MKKMISNVVLLTMMALVLLLIPVFMSHNSPIPVDIPVLDKEELQARKEAAAKAEQKTAQQARLNKIYSCHHDEDCLIVDKDPCGCAAGPSGVTAINVNYVTEFNALNSKVLAKACPAKVSTVKECSSSAKAVCQAHTCKITY